MIFASTSCIKIEKGKERDLMKVLETYKKLGIQDIELGSMHPITKDISQLCKFKKENDVNFTVHGFFPPTSQPFFLNLASQDDKKLKESMKFVKNALETCRRIDAKIYGIHAGYIADWREENMGEKIFLLSDGFFDEEAAMQSLIQNTQEMVDYASQYGIKFAMENSSQVVIKGRIISMMHSHEEFKPLLRAIHSKNFGILIDIGHLRLASNKMNFSYEEFIKSMQSKVFEIHVHQNNGKKDEHLALNDVSWLKPFDKSILKKAAVTIEAMNLEEKDILDNIEFLKEIIK